MPQFYIIQIDSKDVNGPLLDVSEVKEEIETISDDDLESAFVLTLSGVGESSPNSIDAAEDWNESHE